MPQKLEQVQYEVSAWKRSLNFIMDENINLKNRLTEILKHGFDNKQLESAEYFQNKFITEDEQIGLLRNDVGAMDKVLSTSEFKNAMSQKIDSLRTSIRKTEKHFSELKAEFNNYAFEIFFDSN